VDENKGFLTWNFKLRPKATEQLGFSYSVRHPADMPVAME
jgi:hypothetical protein